MKLDASLRLRRLEGDRRLEFSVVTSQGVNRPFLTFDRIEGCCYNEGEENGIHGVAWGKSVVPEN